MWLHSRPSSWWWPITTTLSPSCGTLKMYFSQQGGVSHRTKGQKKFINHVSAILLIPKRPGLAGIQLGVKLWKYFFLYHSQHRSGTWKKTTQYWNHQDIFVPPVFDGTPVQVLFLQLLLRSGQCFHNFHKTGSNNSLNFMPLGNFLLSLKQQWTSCALKKQWDLISFESNLLNEFTTLWPGVGNGRRLSPLHSKPVRCQHLQDRKTCWKKVPFSQRLKAEVWPKWRKQDSGSACLHVCVTFWPAAHVEVTRCGFVHVSALLHLAH